jgi:LytS/YehU family sensor histidine kinase
MANILKQIYLKEKNYSAAFAAYELFVSTNESLSNERSRREVLQKQYEYDIEKTVTANRALTQENQIQALKLQANRYLLISLLIIVGLAILIAYLFVRQNKLKSIQQNLILEQRLRRLQMNPHFIFNALQAIQNFILKNESRLAIKYMSAFASITRHVLENSRLEYITLKKELILIENYLQLQTMRFANRFEYLIDIDEAIDIESIIIPPMLSQPFIENAVEHGLKGVTDNGKIWIIFQLEDQHLCIKIIDNGYGMHTQPSANLPHQSLAIEITKERIALLNKKEKTMASFEIAEAFPLETERKGVRVSLRLPLMQ